MIKNSNILACPYCDTLQEKVALKKYQKALCICCHSTLQHNPSDFNKSLIFSITALMLFIIANLFPFISLEIGGDINTISIFSSILSLYKSHFIILATLVFLFIIIIPAWYLLSMIWVIISFKHGLLKHFTRKYLFAIIHFSPWNMLEVYLMGVVVTLVKIMQIANITFQSGFWAFCFLIFTSVMANYFFNLKDPLFYANEHNTNESS